MGEEQEGSNSNLNKTESQPQYLAPVPEEPSPVLEKESEKPDSPNSNDVNQEQHVNSPLDQSIFFSHYVPEHPKEIGNQDGKKNTGDSIDRDAGLASVVAEKRLALIKAWEESEKTKAENRAYKNHSNVGLWEESKKASIEAQIKKIEENLERKKAEYVEKMKNKMAEIHQYAEEKRAIVEAQKREEFIELEDTAAKFRNRGVIPRKFFACFSA